MDRLGSPPVRSLLFAVAYAVAMLVGRRLTLEGQTLAVVWPACGVATLWLLGRHGRGLAVDVTLLAAITFVANTATGTTDAVAVVFVAVNLSQALLAVALLRRFVPGLWGDGGTRTLDSVSSVVRFTVAATLSSLVAAVVAVVGLAALGVGTTPMSFATHWGRNVYGFLLVVTAAHLVGHALWLRSTQTERPPRRRGYVAELVGLGLASAGLYGLIFGQRTLPLAFVPIVLTLWAGLRFSPVVVTLQSLGGAAIAIGTSMAGRGPFALVVDGEERGLLVQVLLTLLLVSGLSLSVTRAEERRSLRAAEEERHAATRQAALLAGITEAMAKGLVVLDGAGTVVHTNQQAQDLLATPPRDAAWAEVWSAVAERGGSQLDVDVDRGGRREVRRLKISPLRGEAGDTGWVVLVSDATAEVEALQELATFAHAVAHDLRGPLAAMRGWAELVREQHRKAGLDPLMMDRMIDSGRRLDDLVGDLLQHAVAEDARLALVTLALEDVVREVADAVADDADVEIGALPAVHADPALVHQLLTNLVGNAVKFAVPGTRARIAVRGVVEAGGQDVRLHVVDHGAGVPEDQRERIFERLHRGRRDVPGTGLGLAICRRIVERHGGTLVVDDDPHEGSTCFTFTLPAADPAGTVAAPSAGGTPEVAVA